MQDLIKMVRAWPWWVQALIVLMVLGIIVQYWYVFLIIGAIAGGAYGMHHYHLQQIARHNAAVERIARLEKELGIDDKG